MVGFGTWKHRLLTTDGGVEYGNVIDIAWFGIDSRFQSEIDHGGFRLADRLYAYLEEVAREHPDSTPEMPVHLVCDVRNARGLRFWVRMQFEGVEVIQRARDNYVRMIRA